VSQKKKRKPALEKFRSRVEQAEHRIIKLEDKEIKPT
jgi:hypothetical protein